MSCQKVEAVGNGEGTDMRSIDWVEREGNVCW